MSETMKPGEWGTKDGKPAITWYRPGIALRGEPSTVQQTRTYASEEERFDAHQRAAEGHSEKKVTQSSSRDDRANHISKLKAYGAAVSGDTITLYRGGNAPIKDLKQLRYGDHLSAVKDGFDSTGNAGAASYGANCVCLELHVDDVIVTGAGEYQYKGHSQSLLMGKKYPIEIYRAYNDAQGSNYTGQEIDAQDNVRVVASQALPGGRDEFDSLLADHVSSIQPENLEFERPRGMRP